MKQPVMNADEQVLTSDPVERNYDPHVIMKRAEAFFEKEDHAEAAVEYQHFLDLHRSHLLAPYAQYRLGLSHFTQVTTHDRDPEHVRLTIEAMEKLLKDYPGSAYELDAKAKLQESRAHHASYELHVGRHYYRQTAYLAALHRFERVLSLYPGSEMSAEALYYLARTYQDLGATERAIEQLTMLLTHYPKATVRKEGQTLMTALGGKYFQQAAPVMNGAPAPATVTQSVTQSVTQAALPPRLPSAPLATRSVTDTPAAALPLPQPTPSATDSDSSIVMCGMNAMC